MLGRQQKASPQDRASARRTAFEAVSAEEGGAQAAGGPPRKAEAGAGAGGEDEMQRLRGSAVEAQVVVWEEAGGSGLHPHCVRWHLAEEGRAPGAEGTEPRT